MGGGEPTVLLRRGALGDVVLLGAVTARLPGEVVVACEPRWAGAARALRGVDRVVPWPGAGSGRVVDLQGGLRGRVAAPRADRRIRKRSVRRRLRLLTAWSPLRPAVPALYAEAAGVQPQPPPWIPGWTGGDALAVVPGAAWGPKRWPAERFAAVGRAWDGPVVVLGGPGEEALVGWVSARIPGAEAVVERGFDATLDALRGCAAAVCGDTGLMHLAGALGMPVVALFGPTHPDDGFWVYRGEVVQRDAPCRPCALHRVRRCRVGDHRCMRGIAPGAVAEAVRRCAG